MNENEQATEGLRQFHAGRQEQAKQIALNLLKKFPKHPVAFMLLGHYAHVKGRMEEAIHFYRKSLQEKPEELDVLMALAKSYRTIGNHNEVLNTCREVLKTNPKNPEIFVEIGRAQFHLGDFQKAEQAMHLALQIYPKIPFAYRVLASIAKDYHGNIDQSITLCQKAIEIDPNDLYAYNDLGNFYLNSGRPSSACKVFKDILDKTGPEAATTCSNWLLALNYLDNFSREELRKSHLYWQERHKPPKVRQRHEFANSPSVNRKLRVGFTSPDLYSHPVFFFIHSLFSAYDKTQFTFVCFSDRNKAKEDGCSKLLYRLVDEWYPTDHMKVADLDNFIQGKKIDILIDLTGHTAGNRLLNYIQRCAPLQVTWLGYPNTTGLDAMDYRIVDITTDPESWSDELSTEKLYRIPAPFLAFKPEENWYSLESTPNHTFEKITFGTFNNINKISLGAIDLWCKILQQIPEAELVLKCRFFAKKKTYDLLNSRFKVHGIKEERLRILDFVESYEGHMKAYNEIDVALDTFPYNGTTTSCQAMWMGVPFITKAGDRHCARVGMTLLKSVGLDELIADSDEAYVQKAIALVKDRGKLTEIKRTLRQRMLDSPLCDAEGFARKFEAALRKMWQQWCEEKAGK